MKQKYLFIVVGLVILGFISVAVYSLRTTIFPFVRPPQKVSQEAPSAILITQSLDYAGRMASSSADLTLKKGETALRVLQDSHTVEVKHYDFGDLVQSIDGVEASASGYYWIYYVNGQTANVGASQYQPKMGDLILWRLEKEKL